MRALIPLLVLLVGAAHASDRIERGRYLVNTSGCTDCHTPLKMGANGPEPDLARALSGHPAGFAVTAAAAPLAAPWMVAIAATGTAYAGPWGVSFAGNLTSDPDTGLGRWSEDDFVRTIRTGRHLGRGRQVLPPMPIPVYNQMTDGDLQAVFAYLKTVPAVRNKVPAPLAPPAAARP
jgi:hypothetical protein